MDSGWPQVGQKNFQMDFQLFHDHRWYVWSSMHSILTFFLFTETNNATQNASIPKQTTGFLGFSETFCKAEFFSRNDFPAEVEGLLREKAQKDAKLQVPKVKNTQKKTAIKTHFVPPSPQVRVSKLTEAFFESFLSPEHPKW